MSRTSVTPHCVRLVAVAATLLPLLGCISRGGSVVSVQDGVSCGVALDAPAVFIDIDYDASGMPRASPASCELRAGTQLTWRASGAPDKPFAISFKTASPIQSEPRGTFVSKWVNGRQQIVQRLDGPPGRYDYGVRANGKELDPAIIIH